MSGEHVITYARSTAPEVTEGRAPEEAMADRAARRLRADACVRTIPRATAHVRQIRLQRDAARPSWCRRAAAGVDRRDRRALLFRGDTGCSVFDLTRGFAPDSGSRGGPAR